MPTIITRGAMSAQAFGFASSSGLKSFYSAQATTVGANTIILPGSPQPGDICIMAVQDNSIIPPISGSGGAGWTQSGFNILRGGTYRTVLDSTQIAGPIVLTYATAISVVLIVVIRGGAAINALSLNQGMNGTTLDSQTWTGVTKSIGSRGLVMISAAYAGGNGPMVLSSPSLGSTSYLPPTTEADATGSFPFRARGITVFNASQYTNGTNLTVSGLGMTWTQAAIHIFDIT